MNKAQVEAEVTRAAYELRGAAPAAWDQFLKVLEHHCDFIGDAFIESLPDRLQHNQGRAQQARELLKLLQNAPTKVHAMKAAQRNIP